METSKLTAEQQRLNDETQQAWERKAGFWDERMNEGNTFHRLLVAPATSRLLQPRRGETIIDVACGNGQVARGLAALGIRVVAVDFSRNFIERARARTVDHADFIEYHVLDATDSRQLLSLGRQRFDAAVCSMALMDMAVIQPLLRSLTLLLKPGGRFVFTVHHPCFNSNAVTLVAEQTEQSTFVQTAYSVKTSAYLTVPPSKGTGMPGEPEPHYYFHRPLTELLTECFTAGFVMDGIEEPALGNNAQIGGGLSWLNLADVPPVLAVRLRLARTAEAAISS